MNANLSHSGIPFGGYLKGGYADFDEDWYDDIGTTLVNTVFFIGIWPIQEWIMWYTIKLISRYLDKRWCSCDQYRTRKITIQGFIDLYGGPNYLIYWKYSRILNIIFCTMMYGASVPLLYPMALFAFIVQYAVERLSLAYYYKQPPVYDNLLSQSTLKIMKWAIVVNLGLSWWMFGNRQLFSNYVRMVDDILTPAPTGHSVLNLKFIDFTLPLLVVLCIAYFYFAFMWTIPLMLNCCCRVKQV